MFAYGNDFSGSSFGHPTAENNNPGFNGYLSGTPSGGSHSFTRIDPIDGFDLEATAADPRTTVAENWWLGSSLNGDSSQYSGSTVLNMAWNGFTDPYISQTRSTFETNDVVGSDALRQRCHNIPEYQQLSMAAPSPAVQQIQPPYLPPATIVGPAIIPSPVSIPLRGHSPIPIAAPIVTGSCWFGEYGQSLNMQNYGGQWPYPTSVGKGKARATEYPTTTTDDNAWQHQWSHASQHSYTGSNPYMDTGVPNTDLFAPIASSSGPQRSERGAILGVKETETGKGGQKRAPKKVLPPGVDWAQTHDRFYWEMIKVYKLQPSGRLPQPEVAYAEIDKFIREDLHQSPLVVKELGTKPSRDIEQYLTNVLGILYPVRGGEKRDIQGLLDQVAAEIERGLFMVNDTAALRKGHSSKTKPEDLNGSAKKVQHRKVERGRRDASHETLERISFFFKAPPRSMSRNEVLFFAITYIIFGVSVFGDDGFVIAFPRQ